MPAELQSVPPKIKHPPLSPAIFAGAVLTFAMAGAGAVVFFFNPSTHGFYPVCEFHRLTGLNCPGCGGTRAVYALLHEHLALALKDNALFVILLPVVVLRGAWFGLKIFLHRPVGQFFPAKFLWPLLVVAVIFTVLRNLPPFAFLSP